MRRHTPNMLQGPVLPSILLYALPIIATSILQLLFNAADLVVVGQFCGSLSVGAVGATGSITNLIVNLFIGLSNGAGVAVAHGIGGKKDDEVSRIVHTALPVAVISGAIITFIGVVFSETFLVMMNTPESVLPLSVLYMRIYFGGIVFAMIYNFSASILRAAGDTKSPLTFLVIAGVVNVILNIIFVTIFHMNVAGVALATVISQGIAATLVVTALMRRTDACRLMLRKLRIYKTQLLKIVRIGLPAGIQSSLFSIANVQIAASINSFGDVFVSGNSAAANIEGFVYAVMDSFNQTTVNFVGQNAGARQYDRVKKVQRTCLASVFVGGLTCGLLAYGFSPTLLSIYITDSPEAIRYGVERMAYVCVPYFLCGMMNVCTGALRGLGASVTPMLVSVLGVCGFRLGWIYTIFQIPQYHTPQCLYLSYAISWTVTFAVQFAAFRLVCRKQEKQTLLL